MGGAGMYRTGDPRTAARLRLRLLLLLLLLLRYS